MNVLLAAFDVEQIVRRWQTMTPTARDRVVILGALAFVTLLLLFWAIVFRKRNPDSESRRHSYKYPRPGEDNADSKGRRRRKWRRQRRPHRPLNPTLAQTGGLPPIRSDEPPESPR